MNGAGLRGFDNNQIRGPLAGGQRAANPGNGEAAANPPPALRNITWSASLRAQIPSRPQVSKLFTLGGAVAVVSLLAAGAWHQIDNSAPVATALLVASLGAAFVFSRLLSSAESKAPVPLTSKAMVDNINLLNDKDKVGPASEHALHANIDNIVEAVLAKVPEQARGPENRDLLTKELRSMGGLLFDAKFEQLSDIKNLINQQLSDFKSSMKTIERNINQDKQEIADTFFPGVDTEKIILQKIVHVGGETHNGGLKPSFIHLEVDGESKVIVYKPRSIEADRLISGESNSLFALVNHLTNMRGSSSSNAAEGGLAGSEALLPTFPHLSKEGYGYVKFLSHGQDDCRLNQDQMKGYYRTLGAIQALGHIFGIRDLHQENVLVHAGRPYLIDLEVAFNAEGLRRGQLTELLYAVINLEDNMGAPTNSHVTLLDENGQQLSHHARDYLESIREGFDQIKKLVGSQQEAFSTFVDEKIPENLPVRHVLVETSALKSVLYLLPHLRTEAFCDLIGTELYRGETAKTYDFVVDDSDLKEDLKQELEGMSAPKGGGKSEFSADLVDRLKAYLNGRLTDALEENDVKHGDLPFFRTNPKGELFCGNVPLAIAKNDSRDLIKHNIKNLKEVSVQGFLEEIKGSNQGEVADYSNLEG